MTWSLLWPRDDSLAGWFWWFMAGVLAPAVAIFMLVTGPVSFVNAWQAAHGGGELGTLHVTAKACDYDKRLRRTCTGLHGTYTSQDGETRVRQAYLDTIPRGADVGSDVPVRYLGERRPTVVYTATGSRTWMSIGVLLLASAVTLPLWALTVWARLRGRYLPWMSQPWTKPKVIRDSRAPGKTGHRWRRRKRKRR